MADDAQDSGLHVCVRVRGDGGALVVGEGSVRLAGEEGQEAQVDVVHNGTNGDVFRTAKCNKVCEGVLAGGGTAAGGGARRLGFGSILVYGGRGGGKTHTLFASSPTDPGLALRCVSHLFEKGAISLKIQICEVRNDVVKDLIGGTKGVKMTVDDKAGVLLEGETEVCRTMLSTKNLLKKHLAAAEVTPDLTHFCVFLTSFGTTGACTGRLFLIDTADTRHQPSTDVDAALASEYEVLHKGHQVLTQCLSGTVNAQDFEMLPFRETKLTRVLKHPYYYASKVANNHSAVVVCLEDKQGDDENLASLLTFASLARGVPDMGTISEYKDLYGELSKEASTYSGQNRELTSKLEAIRTLHKIKQGELARLMRSTEQKEEELADRLGETRRQCNAENKRAVDEELMRLREGVREAKRRLETVQSIVDGAEGAEESAVHRFEQQHLVERREYRRTVDAKCAQLRAENDSLAFDHEKKRRRAETLQVWSERVEKEIEQLEAEKKELSAKPVKGKSRTEGMSKEEVAAKAEYFRCLDEIDEIENANESLREEIRHLKLDTKINIPTDSEDSDSDGSQSDQSLRGGGGASSVYTSPPQSLASSVASVLGGPPSDIGSDAGSEAEFANLPPEERKRLRDLKALENERQQLKFTYSKEEKLQTLMEHIMKFLKIGTLITVLEDGEPWLVRKHAYIYMFDDREKSGTATEEGPRPEEGDEPLDPDKPPAPPEEAPPPPDNFGDEPPPPVEGEEPGELGADGQPESKEKPWPVVFLAEVDPKTGKCPDKRKFDKKRTYMLKMENVVNIWLGQQGKQFQRALGALDANRRYTASPDSMPKNSEHLIDDPTRLAQFFYRSISLQFNDDTEFSFVADTNIDFEAWEVGLHRISEFKMPQWGTYLNLTKDPDFQRLSEKERTFCRDNHIVPKDFLSAKHLTLNGEKVLITLYDIRSASTLDLMHSEKLFQLMWNLGYIEKLHVWKVRDPPETSKLEPPVEEPPEEDKKKKGKKKKKKGEEGEGEEGGGADGQEGTKKGKKKDKKKGGDGDGDGGDGEKKKKGKKKKKEDG